MTSSKEKIMQTLKNLLKMEDIYACMLVSRGMAGIIPERKFFKKEIIPIWEKLQETTDQMFYLIEEYERYGLKKISFELLEYEVIFFIIPNTNTSLVTISPSIANKGLIMMELSKTREEIVKILK